ncbi:MAG: HAMP domain-containing sensor histidine kinase, partial [Ilumatobacteraceae bacterium]
PLVTRHGAWAVSAVPLTEGRALRVAELTSDADHNALVAVAWLVALAVLLIVLTILAAVRLSSRMNRPLVDLASVAARLGAGDLGARAERSGLHEIDLVADTLHESSARVREVLRRERDLTAETSHQLRTPLAGMRIAIESELADPRNDSTLILDELLAATDRMDSAITRLIALRREPTSAMTATDVSDVVRRTAARWREPIERAGRQLVVHVEDAVARTPARPMAIETILDVLLDNALSHGAGTITVVVERSPATRLVRVLDECRFAESRLDRSRTRHHGIGLVLARSLAEAEQGELRLTKEEPTTFELRLPAQDDRRSNWA